MPSLSGFVFIRVLVVYQLLGAIISFSS